MDITLLMFIIRHSEVIDAPNSGWEAEPDTLDTSPSADLARIKRIRNSAYAHATSASLSKPRYDELRNQLHNIFNRLIPEEKFSYTAAVGTKNIEIQTEQSYAKQIENWYEQDIGLKYAIEKLTTDVNKQSRKMDYFFKKLTRNVTLVSTETAEIFDVQRHLKHCYNNLVSSYPPFEGLNLTVDLGKAPNFFNQAIDVSQILVSEVSIQTEMEIFFTENRQMSVSLPKKPLATSTMKSISFGEKPEDIGKALIAIEGCRGIGKTAYILKMLNMWTFNSGPLRQFDAVLYLPFLKFEPKISSVFDMINLKYCSDSKSMRKKMSHLLKYHCKNFKICFIYDFSLGSKIPEGVLKTICNFRKYCTVIVACRSFSLQITSSVPMSFARRYQLRGLRDGLNFAKFLTSLPNLNIVMKNSIKNMLQMLPEALLKIPLISSFIIKSVIIQSYSSETILTPTILFQKLINLQMQSTVNQENFSILESYNVLFSCADTCFQNLENPVLKSCDFNNDSALTNLLELGFLQENFSLTFANEGFQYECFDLSIHYFLAAYSANNKQFLESGYSNRFDISRQVLIRENSSQKVPFASKLTFVRFLTGLAGNCQQILHWAVSLANVPNKFLFALDLFTEISCLSYQKSPGVVGDVLRALEPVHKSVHVTSQMLPREKAGLLKYLCLKNCSLTALKTDDSLPLVLFVKVLQINDSLRELVLYNLDITFAANLPLLFQAASKSRIQIIDIEFTTGKVKTKLQPIFSGSFYDQILTSLKNTKLIALKIKNLRAIFSTCVGFDLFTACFSFTTLKRLKLLDLSGLKLRCQECNSSICSTALLVYQILLKPVKGLKEVYLGKFDLRFSTCDSFHTFLTTILKSEKSQLTKVSFESSSVVVSCSCDACQNNKTKQAMAQANVYGIVSSTTQISKFGENDQHQILINLNNCVFNFSSTCQMLTFNSAAKSAYYNDISISLTGASFQCLTKQVL